MRCIVNAAIGGYHGTPGNYYPTGQKRLVRTLRTAGMFDGELSLWTDAYPPGCPPHNEVPYAFKPAAMREAAKNARTLLWLDAVMVALRPVADVMREIEKRGYLLWYHPPGEWTVGMHTSDACLAHYGISRGAAFDIQMLCSAVFGYSLDHPLGRQLHDMFIDAPPVALRGAWHNRNNVVSNDRRVQGHRHDQSVLSILAHKLGLKPSHTPYPASFLGNVTEATVFVHDPQGKRGWE